MSADEFDPSKPLPDRRRERFCQELMAGTPLYDAYVEAGFRRPRGNAQRMEQEPEVAARLEHLRGKLEHLEGVMLAFRRVMVRQKLDNIVDIDRVGLFEEYCIRGKRKLRLKSMDQLTTEQRALVEAIEVTKDGIKVTMPNKLAALAQLTKLDGLDKPDRHEHTGKDGGPIATDDFAGADGHGTHPASTGHAYAKRLRHGIMPDQAAKVCAPLIKADAKEKPRRIPITLDIARDDGLPETTMDAMLRQLPLRLLLDSPHARPVSTEHVVALAKSMGEIGCLSPL